MLRRLGSFVALILVATFVLAACGSPKDEVQPTVTRTDAENAPPTRTATVEGAVPEEATTAPVPETTTAPETGGGETGPVTIDVVMVDIAFEVKEIKVPANTEVTVNLVNNGAASHNFTIDELGVASGDMAAGESKTLTFNSGAPGEYEYYCNIPGHKEAGMVGKLIVEEAAAAAVEPTPAGALAESSPSTAAEASPAASPVGAAPATSFDIELLDIKFGTTEMTVPANTEITVNLTNNGAATHNFNIDSLAVASGDIAAGETKSITFNSGAAGEFEYYCAIPGHKEVGMVGKLTVIAEAATANTGAPAEPALPTTLAVEMKDISFAEKELIVPANSEITINLTNTGAASHNFNIDELSVTSGDYIAGQTGTVTFNSGAPGEYQYYCNIPGHKEAGMVGTLIVK